MRLRLQALQEADKHLGIPDHPGEKEKPVKKRQREGREDLDIVLISIHFFSFALQQLFPSFYLPAHLSVLLSQLFCYCFLLEKLK